MSNPQVVDVQRILVRRCGGVAVFDISGVELTRSRMGSSGKDKIAALIGDMMALGYAPDKSLYESFDSVTRMGERAWDNFSSDLLQALAEERGVRRHAPLYADFPEGMADRSEVDLLIDAALYACSNFEWKPECPPRLIGRLKKYKKPTILKAVTFEDISKILDDIGNQPAAWSQIDKLDFIKLSTHISYIPDKFSNRENIAHLNAMLWDSGKRIMERRDYRMTDVLRFAAACGGGDVSLATPTHYPNFCRPLRRKIANMILRIYARDGDEALEDCSKYVGRWKRLLHGMHINEFYPPNNGDGGLQDISYLQAFAGHIRGNEVTSYFNRDTEELISNGSIDIAAKHLSEKPGMLIRRIDELLEKGNIGDRNGHGDDIRHIVAAVRASVGEASSTVLFQALKHLSNRIGRSKQMSVERIVFPKGNALKYKTIAGKNPFTGKKREAAIEIANLISTELKGRFAIAGFGGKTYDPRLNRVLVPFSNRSASRSARSVPRGSRVEFSGNLIRLFLYWKENPFQHNVDLDLSVTFVDKNYRCVGICAYASMKDIATHSGDVREARNGASEFVDIDVPKALGFGAKYAVMSVNSYSGEKFADLEDCFAGYMERDGKTGEIFEPTTVEDRYDISSGARTNVPLVFDLENREFYVADFGKELNGAYHTAYVQTEMHKGLIEMLESVSSSKPTVGDLLKLCGATPSVGGGDVPLEFGFQTEKILNILAW